MFRPPNRKSLKYLRMCLAADAKRCPCAWWKHPGFWAVLGHRVRRFRKFGPWYRMLALPADVVVTLVRMQTSTCELPCGARIGPGLYLPHPNGVIISDDSRIGPEVAIFQQVTLGGWNNRSPRVHAHATMFAGAKAIGGVKIGLRAFVGANAVVSRDVPAWHVAVGIPAVSKLRTDDAAREAGIAPALRPEREPEIVVMPNPLPQAKPSPYVLVGRGQGEGSSANAKPAI